MKSRIQKYLTVITILLSLSACAAGLDSVRAKHVDNHGTQPVSVPGNDRVWSKNKDKIRTYVESIKELTGYLQEYYYQPLTEEQENFIAEELKQTMYDLVYYFGIHDFGTTIYSPEEYGELTTGGNVVGIGIQMTNPVYLDNLKKINEYLLSRIPILKNVKPEHAYSQRKLRQAAVRLLSEQDQNFKTLYHLVGKNDADSILSELGVQIIHVFENTPADKAGLRDYTGWYITAVNDIPLCGKTLKYAADNIRGQSQTRVKLTLVPPKDYSGPFEGRDIMITRDRYYVPAIKVKNETDDITMITIYEFMNRRDEQAYFRALQSAEAGKRGLIIDLRNCPGGYLGMAVDMTSMLLPVNTPIIIAESRGDNDTYTFYAGHDRWRQQVYTGPVVVLVNGGSASASEIMTAALKENKRAVIIGEKTFGKASIQTIFQRPLKNGYYMRLTTGIYKTPIGHEWIHGQGIEPDIGNISDNPETKDRDEAREFAIGQLREMMKNR